MRVSVAIATYNGERFLPEQLDSIARQDRHPDELVVCDDASQDSTEKVIRDFATKAPFEVRFQKNPRNVGSNQTFERAIADCTGDIILLADQDDLWMPNKTRRLTELLEKAHDVGLVFSDALVVSEDGKSTQTTLWNANGVPKQARGSSREFNWFAELLRRNVVTGATTAFRSKYRDLVLPFPSNTVHDYWLALMIGAVAPIAGIDEPLIQYRQHGHQQIGPPKPLWERTKKAWTLQAADYQQVSGPYVAARERLITCAGLYQTKYMPLLEEKIHHQTLRASTQGRLQRAPMILKELMTGNYHRFDFGVASAIKDLLR